MDRKVGVLNICANIKIIMGDVSYEQSRTQLYTNLVKHNGSKKKA